MIIIKETNLFQDNLLPLSLSHLTKNTKTVSRQIVFLFLQLCE